MSGSHSETGAVPVAERVVVISDLHITPAAKLGNFHAGGALAAWTAARAKTAGPGSILVLAGDIIDFLLLETRPDTIDLANAPQFVHGALDRLQREQGWVQDWKQGLSKWREKGGQIVLLPGNHDPEWYHPDTSAVLSRWLCGQPDRNQIDVWRKTGAWQAKVGDWDVMVDHGHRADAINDIDPADIHAALQGGRASVRLPPGSELVIGPLMAFKRAMDPQTGRRRFPFLDAVKPETRSVMLLLLYLDAGMVMRLLPASLKPLSKMLIRSLHRRLFGGRALSFGEAASPASAAELLAGELAEDVYDALSDSDRAAAAATEARLQAHLSSSPLEHGGRVRSVDVLAPHGGPFRALLRAWLRRERSTAGRFFDPSKPDASDRRMMEARFEKSRGPLVAVSGHTHAARRIEQGAHHVYLNTGTWTSLLDLSRFDDSDQALRELVDVLEGGTPPVFQRRTWAEITPAGPALREDG